MYSWSASFKDGELNSEHPGCWDSATLQTYLNNSLLADAIT